MARMYPILSLALAALLIAAPGHAAPDEETKRPIDYFDKVEIDILASKIKAIGEKAGSAKLPADSVKARFVLFIPKVKEDAEGFWETNLIRFASMSVKAGEYSWPLSGVSASIQFIDNRPMRMIIGRRPGGRDAILPGSQDFSLFLTRENRSSNDYSLEFSSFAFGLFGEKGVEYVAGEGDATIRVVSTQKATKKKPKVDFGFSIGDYRPDE
ncbi:MAG: hypothetical protein AAF337_06795 [Pseudomonadota bacterium]